MVSRKSTPDTMIQHPSEFVTFKANPRRLNRWFKRTYGVTPAQYQQQIGTRPAVSRRG